MNGLLIVVSGPSSGAGKDSVIREIEKKKKLAKIVTFTSREKRPGEKKGVGYHFITRKEFLQKKSAGFFLETNQYRGNFYGTPKDEVLRAIKQGENVLVQVDVNGAKEIKKQFPEVVTIFIYAAIEEMRKRLIKRGREGIEEIEKKLAVAKEQMKEKDKDYFDYKVYNREGQLKKTVEEVLEIIESKKKR